MLITAIDSVICALSLYTVYGNVIRHETTLHDLRNRVELLQNQQTLSLAELKGEIPPQVLEALELPPEAQDAVELGEPVAQPADQPADVPISSSTNAA